MSSNWSRVAALAVALATVACALQPATADTGSGNLFELAGELGRWVQPDQMAPFVELIREQQQHLWGPSSHHSGRAASPLPGGRDLHAYEALFARGAPAWIRSHGYPFEVHEIETADSYILTVHRIPHGRNETGDEGERPVVLLQHGITDSSYTWVANSPSNSLGFMLADAGFDVWMPNSRGNAYSTKHRHLSEGDPRFWHFSHDEMALYDVPAVIRSILATTGAADLAYVGHSQGTTIGLLAFSTFPELARQVRKFFALAPVVNIQYSPSLIFRTLSMLRADTLLSAMGVGNFVPEMLAKNMQFLCYWVPSLCQHLTCAICGCDIVHEIDRASISRIFTEYPSPTSLQNMIHWGQRYRTGRIQKFDRGAQENFFYYGESTPPAYNLTKLSIPVHFYSGELDQLADPTDTRDLWRLLPKHLPHTWIKMPTYGHASFVWSLDAAQSIYPDIISEVHPKHSDLPLLADHS